MSRNHRWLAYLIFALMGIGIVTMFLSYFRYAITPIIVFALIFLLYKFPPNRWRTRSTRKSTPRKHSFRVIQGNKDRNKRDMNQR